MLSQGFSRGVYAKSRALRRCLCSVKGSQEVFMLSQGLSRGVYAQSRALKEVFMLALGQVYSLRSLQVCVRRRYQPALQAIKVFNPLLHHLRC